MIAENSPSRAHAKCGRILRGYPPAADFAQQGRGAFQWQPALSFAHKKPAIWRVFLASDAAKSEYRGVSGLRVGLVDRLDVDGDAAVLRVVLCGGVLFAVTLDDEALRVDALLREVLRDGLGAAL